MELAFETKPLRELCHSADKAKLKFGAKTAAVLKDRLADLRAAATIEDLPLGKPRKMSGGYVLDLTRNTCLVVAPNHPTNPLLPSGAIDWSKVTRVKILGIEVTA